MNRFQKEIYKKTIARAVGGQTQNDFAEAAGLTKGNFSRIYGGQLAKPETLKKIANASSTVTYLELMIAADYVDREILGFCDSTQPNIADKPFNIPIIPGKNDEMAPVKTYKFFSQDMQAADYQFYIVEDDALAPRICKGDRVLLEESQVFKDGDIVLFSVNNEGRMLRYLRKEKKKYYYYGNDLLRYPMTVVDAAAVKIDGVVEMVISYVKNK